MYHLTNHPSTSESETVILEMEGPGFYIQSFNSPGPGDEEDDDEKEDDDENESSTEKSADNTGADNDPPIDEDVVHSPLPPRTGGRPK